MMFIERACAAPRFPIGERTMFTKIKNLLDHPFMERHGYTFLFGGIIAVILALFFLIIEFSPDLSHLRTTLYSGSRDGNYFAIAQRITELAGERGGRVGNVESRGSIENIERLAAERRAGRACFALVQGGLTVPRDAGLELVAKLTTDETVFFIGPEADRIRNIADLRGLSVGAGPVGSGTDSLARRIFDLPELSALAVRLSNHGMTEQLEMLAARRIDLGIFVIADDAAFIKSAIKSHGMQIADFLQYESLADRLPFLKPGKISMGYYDPVANVPARDKYALRVHTLVLSNGIAPRTHTIGMLETLSDLYPGLVEYNRSRPNRTGIPYAHAAADFMKNGGPELLDRYAPVLSDLVPLGIVIQLAMALSILFNVMGAGNRFLLWRIDVNRCLIEEDMRRAFGGGSGPLAMPYNGETGGKSPREIRSDLEKLLERCRRNAKSMLVPMGQEMAYRYQENLILGHIGTVDGFQDAPKNI
jgi:hypothetical protein